MSQTKKGSFVEACFNTLIGFIVTLVMSPLIYWICGVEISAQKMTACTLLFTVVSIVRGYIIRRFFNKIVIRNVSNK